MTAQGHRVSWPCRWRTPWRAWLSAAALLLAGAAAQSAAAQAGPPSAVPQRPGLLDFSAAERQRIAQHGPWPPPPALDPGNALAGRPAAIHLGHRLFFDPGLAPDGRLACASCHVPALGFADGRPRGQGREPLARNTPSLLNAGQQRWLGWDGAFDSLWSQALQPLLDPREMASHPAHLRQQLQQDPTLACLWAASGPPVTPNSATPTSATAGDQALLRHLAKALGAYVATLQSGRTTFDRFRDALVRGDWQAASHYPLAAQRGLRLFIGVGQCHVCHSGPLFSNGEFADTGLPHFVRPGVVDPGRQGGIAALLANANNLLGPHSDAPGGAHDPVALKTRHVLPQHRNFGEFKVPSLRNLAHTAPYMHDGQLATLADVVQHYSAINLERLHADGEQILKPLNLSTGQQADLLAFLRSLSLAQAPTALAKHPSGACPKANARRLR